MYSRIPRQPPRPAGVPSYRQRVTPPPNYSGNAFPAEPDPDDARPRFDGLPTVSTLPARDMPPASEEPVSASAQESDADCSASASADNFPGRAPLCPAGSFAFPVRTRAWAGGAAAARSDSASPVRGARRGRRRRQRSVPYADPAGLPACLRVGRGRKLTAGGHWSCLWKTGSWGFDGHTPALPLSIPIPVNKKREKF